MDPVKEWYAGSVAQHACQSKHLSTLKVGCGADRTPGIISLWHDFRIPALLLTFAALLALRIYLHLASNQEGLRVFPNIYDSVAPAPQGDKAVSGPTQHVKQVAKASGPKRIKGDVRRRNEECLAVGPTISQTEVFVFYSSLTGTTEQTAKKYLDKLGSSLDGACRARALDLSEIDYDEYFIAPPRIEGADGQLLGLFYVFFIPSYNIDSINDTFLEYLRETHHDFRIDTAPLHAVHGYAVFGLGDKDGWPTEDEGFCFQAKEVDRWMAKLTGHKRAYPLGMGDPKRDGAERLDEWHAGLADVLSALIRTGSLDEGVRGSNDAVASDDDFDDDDGEVIFEEPVEKTAPRSNSRIDDVEDLGRIMSSSQLTESPLGKNARGKVPLAVDFTTDGSSKPKGTVAVNAKQMVPRSSPTYTALTKQGYSIVGSHSGVKICRWTKSALRGRGSCYKFSFYGINSHQCMETTPSLSCSNKCVFCWRHGSNPVGTTWRWVVDPPQLIFDGVKENHYKKIKMFRGVPGVRAERFAEAMRIRHCALSLVGEPIFYPHINEFLSMLHSERISSFLVCNAQHPDELAALNHVTQLYVSIDASNRESLRKIDRPLHRDFWERFQRCLEILRDRRFKQRTVFRLTLVKGFNVEDEVAGYADLVDKGLPCFVEIKGVTYCGTSTAGNAGLTMENVPFYEEVCEFVTSLEKELQRRGLGYGIAAEHAHSCCILLASERFRVNGRWHTIIDYDRFFELWEQKGPDGDFAPEEYMGPATPEWAAWGNGGFDPRDQRVDRKGRPLATT